MRRALGSSCRTAGARMFSATTPQSRPTASSRSPRVRRFSSTLAGAPRVCRLRTSSRSDADAVEQYRKGSVGGPGPFHLRGAMNDEGFDLARFWSEGGAAMYLVALLWLVAEGA